MEQNHRPLVPAFLNRLDAKLLRNKPATWQTQTHLVLYFSVVFAAVLALLSLLVFFDAKQPGMVSGWVTFTALVALIGFVVWMIYLLRFNVFKRFGNWQPWDGLKTMLLFFICTGCMVAVCFIPSAVQTYRANLQFGNEEIVHDMNEINTNACLLEYDILPLKWTPVSYKVLDREELEKRRSSSAAIDTAAIRVDDSTSVSYSLADTAELRSKLNETDSVVKVNDSIYIFFECPRYNFVSNYGADEYTAVKVLTAAQLYRNVVRNYVKPDRAALTKRMEALKTKWAAKSRYGYYDGEEPGYDNEGTVNFETRITRKYSLGKINNGINNAVSSKYEWKERWPSYLRVFYYCTLVLTLLVFIFRHSTVKTFFLSLLTAVVMVIVTGLMLLASYGSSETSLLSFIVFYYIVFGGIALSIFGAGKRSAVQGIGLNLFVFMTPFMPLVFVALNEAIYYSNYEPGLVRAERNTALYFFIAEITGAVLLLAATEPLFKKLYRKWFAAPEG
ncbi:MAG: hypothetical protein U0V75_10575 [Ferruginibacter sp.]